MLTMGGGVRGYLSYDGAGGGHVFWVNRIAPSKKFKPPRSGMIINVCAVKNVTRGSRKIVMGGKPNNAPPPPMQKKRPPPPPPPHGKNGPHVERKDCPHSDIETIPHRTNSPLPHNMGFL